MMDDKSNPPVAARKTLKLSSPKSAAPKPAIPAVPAPRTEAAPAPITHQHAPKSGRGVGPADWADAHKRRMQADMDALMQAPAAAATRR